MNRASVELLYGILDQLGYAYSREGGEARLVMRAEGRSWQTVCRMTAEAALVYSAFPFEIGDAEAAARYCSEANARLLEGCMFVGGGGKTVIARCTAMRTDDFFIEQQLLRALERNAAIMRVHWARLYKASARP